MTLGRSTLTVSIFKYKDKNCKQILTSPTELHTKEGNFLKTTTNPKGCYNTLPRIFPAARTSGEPSLTL